jgi:hypothetical protein
MEAGILNGLLAAYRRSGEPRVRDSLLRGARYLCEHVVTRDGLLYYKEAPITITHAHPSNIMLMAPLRFAYEESGERLFLDRLYRFFRWMLECGDLPGYNLGMALPALGLLHREGLLQPWTAPRILG